jgi:hypothetical protein
MIGLELVNDSLIRGADFAATHDEMHFCGVAIGHCHGRTGGQQRRRECEFGSFHK